MVFSKLESGHYLGRGRDQWKGNEGLEKTTWGTK